MEIEQLIQQVMSGGAEPPKTGEVGAPSLPASLAGQSPEQIESLLRFLIYLVLHKEKMSPRTYEKAGGPGGSEAERTKKSLLELLKSDESLRQSLFPGTAMHRNESQQAMQQVSEQDKRRLAGLGANIGLGRQQLRDPAAEAGAGLLGATVNMELEHNDVLKASTVSFKFVAFQSPSSLPPGG